MMHLVVNNRVNICIYFVFKMADGLLVMEYIITFPGNMCI